MPCPIRILFLADTHLGFDLPVQPRIDRRRRGHDFLANYAAALQPALDGQVDLVVHGGDVFDRPRIPASLAYQALEPLVRIADRGIPVFVVPGNHERSALPHRRFATHPLTHVFDTPRTFVAEVRGVRIALAGFPYERRNVRNRFLNLVEQTGWRQARADVRMLCMHHCVEGATVGPGNFTFTYAADVVRGSDIPAQFAVVLSGHIHRRQALTHDLRRRPLAAPVLYAGSIERTSFAEATETKGYVLVQLQADEDGARARWQFQDLYARPMIAHELVPERFDDRAFESTICALIDSAPPDAVLRLRINGALSRTQSRLLSAPRLRSLAPDSMNVEIAVKSL